MIDNKAVNDQKSKTIINKINITELIGSKIFRVDLCAEVVELVDTLS